MTNMASPTIFSLNDDCLTEIMSYLDDHRSFYSFALICKRLYQVSLRKKDWHINVVKRKMKYHAGQFLRQERTQINMIFNVSCKELIRVLAAYEVTKTTLDNVLKVWRSRGPVPAKVFTWIMDVQSKDSRDYNDHITDEFHEENIITLLLPTRCEKMTLHTSHKYSKTKLCYWSLTVKCGEVHVKAKSLYKHGFGLYMNWGNILKSAINVLQDELGETNPPLTGIFLLWLCNFPAGSLSYIDEDLLNDKISIKIHFVDATKNHKPTTQSIWPFLDRFDNANSRMKRIAESVHVKKMLKYFKKVQTAEQCHNIVITPQVEHYCDRCIGCTVIDTRDGLDQTR